MYLQAKTVVAEILEAQTGAGLLLDGYLIRTEYDDFKPAANFIWVEDGLEPSDNLDNIGNRYSCMVTTLQIVLYMAKNPEQNLDVDAYKNQTIDAAWRARKIFKNNVYLVSASAPEPGFAQRTTITEVQGAYFRTDDGTERPAARFGLQIWHMQDDGFAE